MAYKAVFINESHIAHAGRPHIQDASGRWHFPAGSPMGGQFMNKPDYDPKSDWSGGNSSSGSTASGYYRDSSNYSVGGNSNPSSNTPGGNSNTSTGPVNYTREDPYTLTNDELKERNLRGQLITNYNKNYGSTAEDFAKAANSTKQFINDGGTFVKKMMPDKIYVPLDLSNMSDEQLRAANNRAQLESQYNQYFNPPKQNKSKEWVDVALTGANLLISASAIAAPIVWDIIKSKKQGG